MIRAMAEVTLARDEADFTVGVERLRKRAELERRRPLGIAPAARRDDVDETGWTGEASTVAEVDGDPFEAVTVKPVKPVEATVKTEFGFSAASHAGVKSPQAGQHVATPMKPSEAARLLHAAGIGLEAIADEAVKLYPGIDRKLVAQAVRRLKQSGDQS
jgi:hypothetical protein